MLRGSRLVKNNLFSSVVRSGFIASPSFSTQFLRLQHTKPVEGSNSSETEVKAKPAQKTKAPLSQETLEKRRQEFVQITDAINEKLQHDFESGKSSNELVESFFGLIAKKRFLKDNYKSMQKFSEPINLIISKSINELSDPNQKRIPISPQDILAKAISLGVASAPNFDSVAFYLLKNGEISEVLPLWVSFIEYKTSNNMNYLFGENELVISAIIAYAEITSGKNTDLESLKSLLQITTLPALNSILSKLGRIMPDSEKRYQEIKNALNRLMIASRDPNSLSDLRRAYNAASIENPITVSRIFKDTKFVSETSGKPISLETYVGFMSCFNQVNRAKEIFQIWNDILKSGYSPNIDAWNQLLEASGKIGPFSKRLGQAQGIFEKIKSPNPETYAKLFEIYYKFGEQELAEKLLTTDNLESPIFVNSYLQTLSENSDIKDLEKTLKKLQTSKALFSLATYNSLLARFTKAGDFSKAKRIFNEISEANLSPDIKTFSVILNMTLKSIYSKGDIATTQVIDDILNEMKKAGIAVNDYTISTLIDLLTKDPFTFRSAEFLFKYLKENNKAPVVSYVSIISNAFATGKTKVAEGYLTELLNSGLKLNDGVWAMVFEGWCKDNNVEKSSEYLKLAQSLPQSKAHLNNFSYLFLLRTALNKKSPELAAETFEAIEASKFPLNKLSSVSKRTISELASKGIKIPEYISKETI